MANLTIASRKFKSEVRETPQVPYLLSCIGEKINIETEVYYENIFISSEDQLIYFAESIPLDLVDTLDVGKMIYSEYPFFNECAVGDTIVTYDLSNGSWEGNNEEYTIAQISADGKWAIMEEEISPSNGVFGGGGESEPDQGYLANITPMKVIKYDYNFVEGGNSYLSKTVPSQLQRFYVNNADSEDDTPITMLKSGDKSWQIGDATIEGNFGEENRQQRFIVKHDTAIIPLFLAEQYDDLRQGKAPDYFKGESQLYLIQRFYVNNADSEDDTPITMLKSGDKSWQIGDATIEGNFGEENRQQRFIVKHDTAIIPLFLAEQYEDLRQGKAPDYFKGESQLYLIQRFYFAKNISDKNTIVALNESENGQIGWFNETLNGGESKYKVSSLTLKKGDDYVDALEFDAEITIEVIMTNVDDSFIDSDTPFVFGFNYLPEDSSLYDSNGKTYTTNFLFDSKKGYLDDVEYNGDNYGEDMQVIKSVMGERIDDNTAKFTIKIYFGSDAKEIMSQGQYKRYAFWIINENVALDPEFSDKTNTLLQVSEIYVNLINTNLLDIQTVFLEHPYEDSEQGKETLEMFPTDDVVANSEIFIDYDGIQDNGIKFISCEPQLVLAHETQADIVLDSVFMNLDGVDTITYDLGGEPVAIQLYDKVPFSARPYKVPNSIRNQILFGTDEENSSGTVRAWAMSFPFMNRWEYWIRLIASNVPSELLNLDEDFNGINHFWNRLVNIPNWSLQYRLKFVIEQNGVRFQQVKDHELTSTGYDSNTDWDNNTIKSYDLQDNELKIVSPSKKFVKSSELTKIVAEFQKVNGELPDENEFAIVLWAEQYEGSGVAEITQISSSYEVDSRSWFKSYDNSNKTVLEKDGDIYRGIAYLDNTKLPQSGIITLYARIYEVEAGANFNVRVINDATIRVLLSGEIRVII